MGDIEALREEIDELDAALIDLIGKRAAVAKRIGEAKKEAGKPIRDERRETALLSSVRERAARLGLDPDDAERIFKEVIAACRRVEGEETTVAFLGPEGTFTEEAARSFFPSSGTAFKPCSSIFDVFRAVEGGDAMYGVVPIENSTEGSVSTTLDLLLSSNLMVRGEVELKVQHNLIAKPGIEAEQIKTVLSHPQALEQCRRYLREHLPNAVLKETASTATAVKAAKELEDAAAIGHQIAAERYGMKILARGIQDSQTNYTRFFVLGKQDQQPTGGDETSIIFSVVNVPGALYRALGEFAERDVNITKIESRPTKQKAWDYVFFLDFEGHRKEPKSVELLGALKEKCIFLKVLGSYPTRA